MKRKTLALLLCAALLLTACAAAPTPTTPPTTTAAPTETTTPVETTTAPPETTAPAAPTEPAQACRIDGSKVIAGNLTLAIPEGYAASPVNDNAVMLASPDGKCGISIFAADISSLDEAATMAYIPMQKESFYSDDAVQSDIEVIGPYTVGGFDVTMEVYSEIFTDLSMYSVLTTTFTDSWYGYTILLKTAEISTEDYATAYGQMVMTAKYTGPAARFDFVQ